MSNNILDIFDSNEIESISALIDRLEKSSFDYLKLESGKMSIVIGKNGAGEASAASAGFGGKGTPVQTSDASASVPGGGAPAGGAPVGSVPTGGALTDGAPAAAGSPASVAAVPVSSSSVTEEEGVYIIKSPSYGIFYAQSEPGMPPYVTVGAEIKADDTIGLMEIMKTFTAITSPVAGLVTAIHVKNEETLEPDQPLVSVKVS